MAKKKPKPPPNDDIDTTLLESLGFKLPTHPDDLGRDWRLVFEQDLGMGDPTYVVISVDPNTHHTSLHFEEDRRNLNNPRMRIMWFPGPMNAERLRGLVEGLRTQRDEDDV